MEQQVQDNHQVLVNNSNEPRILIVGGGIFSLCFAYNITHNTQALDDINPKSLQNWEIFEASQVFGGLAQSMKDQQGFTWDIGGHVTFDAFGKYYQMLDTLGIEFNHISRNSKVWCHGEMIDYPIQMHIWQMNDEDKEYSLKGLIEAADKYPDKPNNYEEWCRKFFGDGIYDIFFEPYNEKIWGVKLKEMNVTWTGARFPTIDVEEVKQSVHDKVVKQWGHNAKFRYPKVGGNGSQWTRVAELLPQDKLHINYQLTKIDPLNRIAYFANGETRNYDKLISTIPLTHLIDMIDVQDDPILNHINKNDFIYSTAYIIGFGISGTKQEATKDLSWAYFPDKDIPFYRVTWLSNYSDDLVPDPQKHWSLLLEVNVKSLPERLRQSSPANHKEIEDLCLDALLKLGIIQDWKNNEIEIVSRYIQRIEYSYPVPFLNRDDILSKLLPHLENNYSIYSRGRFGDWKYEISNQDQIFLQSIDLAKQMVSNIEKI